MERMKFHHQLHFNTSHVSIKPQQKAVSLHPKRDFNTSHVSIKRGGVRFPDWYGNISIHPMFLLNPPRLFNVSKSWPISIHPMFLLNPVKHCRGIWKSWISIHPMFLLNTVHNGSQIVFFNFNTSHVSIKLRADQSDGGADLFQYIPCFY